MSTPLLNCFIFICKLVICIGTLVSLRTHHWIREYDGKRYGGLHSHCRDYGYVCVEMIGIQRIIWILFAFVLTNVLLESCNLLLLRYKRRRSRMNLVIEELAIIVSFIFLIPTLFTSIFLPIMFRGQVDKALDWSFFLFALSSILALIELICSFVRVVSYCRANSFRSGAIRYTSKANQETVHIQT